MFPLGKYTKSEVRKLAKKFALPTSTKEESMGICFIGEVPIKEFLENKIKTKSGDIILSTTGEKIGEHDGLAFYTLGQRHGFLKLGTKPLFSRKINDNQLLVGYEDDSRLWTKKLKWKIFIGLLELNQNFFTS